VRGPLVPAVPRCRIALALALRTVRRGRSRGGAERRTCGGRNLRGLLHELGPWSAAHEHRASKPHAPSLMRPPAVHSRFLCVFLTIQASARPSLHQTVQSLPRGREMLGPEHARARAPSVAGAYRWPRCSRPGFEAPQRSTPAQSAARRGDAFRLRCLCATFGWAPWPAAQPSPAGRMRVARRQPPEQPRPLPRQLRAAPHGWVPVGCRAGRAARRTGFACGHAVRLATSAAAPQTALCSRALNRSRPPTDHAAAGSVSGRGFDAAARASQAALLGPKRPRPHKVGPLRSRKTPASARLRQGAARLPGCPAWSGAFAERPGRLCHCAHTL
jgi:hypothetical protein